MKNQKFINRSFPDQDRNQNPGELKKTSYRKKIVILLDKLGEDMLKEVYNFLICCYLKDHEK